MLFAFALLFSSVLSSQNKGGIKGTITDQSMNDEPMLFANVQLKDSETSYQTNFHGNFEISDIQPGAYTLLVSYAGYQTKEIQVSIRENEISKVEAGMQLMELNFDLVEGIDTVSKEETGSPSSKK